MTPPTMAAWNLALRLGLELGALAGIGLAAWELAPGATRWVAVVLGPLAAATIWGVFNVIDDPSRSGAAPVEVAGWARLGIELLILGGGAAAVATLWRWDAGLGFALLITIHYAASTNRLRWLLHA